MIEIPLSKTGKHAGKYVAIVDDIDADLAELNWSVEASKYYTPYANRMIKQKRIKLHRVILERMLGRPLVEGEKVDHIDRDGLNCKRENLRLATHAQNMSNRKINKNNTSGYKGVFWKTKIRKYQARIQVNKKRIYLGDFDDPKEAHKAYCKAADELNKDFANHG